MFTPELDPFDGNDSYQWKSSGHQYAYKMAQHDRSVAIGWHRVARAGALVLAFAIPATIAVARLEHIPPREAKIIYTVEGLAETAAINGIRMANRDISRSERTMDSAAASQLALAHETQAEPQTWAFQHEPFSTTHAISAQS